MIPSWITNALVAFLGCIFAIYLGATLPDFDMLGAYLLGVAIISTVCVVSNNFALLLALALWFPFAPPLPFIHAFPTVSLVFAWFGVVIFFRLCMTKTLNYIPSCNLFILLCFAWVPIRFALNPVHKLGATAGGQGVSGANAYFLYGLAGVLVVAVGCVLNSRKKLTSYMRCAFWVVAVVGVALFVCAFIPSTGPFLASMGMFAAGNLTDGIQRLVVLPGYGLFLVEASLCPVLFRLNGPFSFLFFLAGFAMMIIGGNRSAMAAAIIAVPVILLLRRKTYALLFSIVFMLLSVGIVHLVVEQMDTSNVPPLLRSVGMLDAKIDDATGGSASAGWRYAVWQSGMEKIMESPFIGKGFGNLDLHIDTDPNQPRDPTDFESILAGGEAHNGFISAAYGFGIPFMLCLSAAVLYRLFSHIKSALKTDPRDPELRDFHAFLAANFATFGILVYAAFDLCTSYFWLYVGMGIIMDHITRGKLAEAQSKVVHQDVPGGAGVMYPGSLTHKLDH